MRGKSSATRRKEGCETGNIAHALENVHGIWILAAVCLVIGLRWHTFRPDGAERENLINIFQYNVLNTPTGFVVVNREYRTFDERRLYHPSLCVCRLRTYTQLKRYASAIYTHNMV